MENKRYSFRVAGHLFDVFLPKSYDMKGLLPSFEPFYCKKTQELIDAKPILRVNVSSCRIETGPGPSAILLTENIGVLGDECRLYECGKYYFIETRYVSGGCLHQMRVSRDFYVSDVFIDRQDAYGGQALSLFILFAYAQRSVFYGSFLLHASVVVKGGIGYAFLGKSGTGKSTHSSLWLKNIADTSLLNDDNPVVHFCVKTRTAWISGSPWSGKTRCYKRQTVRLGALVRLVQSPSNQFTLLDEFDALLSVLPGCSSMRWHHRLYSVLCNVLEDLVKQVPVGMLECLPDASASELCYEQIKIITKNEKM